MGTIFTPDEHPHSRIASTTHTAPLKISVVCTAVFISAYSFAPK